MEFVLKHKHHATCLFCRRHARRLIVPMSLIASALCIATSMIYAVQLTKQSRSIVLT